MKVCFTGSSRHPVIYDSSQLPARGTLLFERIKPMAGPQVTDVADRCDDTRDVNLTFVPLSWYDSRLKDRHI